MSRTLSPFRYPGGKQALVGYVADFMRANGLRSPDLVEPFAGGAAVSLGLLQQGLVERITLVERDPLMFAFWRCVQRSPDQLVERIQALDVNLKTWHRLQPLRALGALRRFPLLDLAVAAIFFNRTNFSGVLDASPIGGYDQSSAYGIDCRWNASVLTARIAAIAQHKDQIEVVQGDAVAYLRAQRERMRRLAQQQRVLVYVDPPYVEQGPNLYRFAFKREDHIRLAGVLNPAPYPWLITYDDHPLARDLYRDHRQARFHLQYVVREARRGRELLVTNQNRLPKAVRVGSQVTCPGRRDRIKLVSGERVALREIATSESTTSRRARIVLLLAEGLSGQDVAVRLKTSEQTVCLWRDRFLTGRLEGLLDAARSGRPSQIGVDVAGMVRRARRRKGATCRTVAAVTGVSPSTVSRMWRVRSFANSRDLQHK